MSEQVNNGELVVNGWAAVPRSFTKSLADVDKNKHAELSVAEAVPPSSHIARKTQEFARQQLSPCVSGIMVSLKPWYVQMAQSTQLDSLLSILHAPPKGACLRLDML
jgi:hypothetical protein